MIPKNNQMLKILKIKNFNNDQGQSTCHEFQVGLIFAWWPAKFYFGKKPYQSSCFFVHLSGTFSLQKFSYISHFCHLSVTLCQSFYQSLRISLRNTFYILLVYIFLLLAFQIMMQGQCYFRFGKQVLYRNRQKNLGFGWKKSVFFEILFIEHCHYQEP